ncbi:unnamed protein product [Symbiodinium natans]|uniref:Uncharacterized protein n=1 Tax=Symbiodinium natans TaxID=878477 RepID=A0A812UA89_9DINO|nr:unnamed protein product [Symbiodinium natans]
MTWSDPVRVVLQGVPAQPDSPNAILWSLEQPPKRRRIWVGTQKRMQGRTRDCQYHLSEDTKRVVLRLRKVYDTFSAGSWAAFLDVRTGRHFGDCLAWPHILTELQGAWRSDDEEPIEVVGDQVVWPRGSRDVLIVDGGTDTFTLRQTGDGNKVPCEEFHGFYERQSHRVRWDDGDTWSRIPGLALSRKEAGREALPLEYDKQLARWVPWLPAEELRRETLHWLPPLDADVGVRVSIVSDEPEDTAFADEVPLHISSLSGPLNELKRQLLSSLTEEEDDQEDGKNAEELVLADFDALPVELLRRCRVCALSSAEAGISAGSSHLAESLLALRRGEPLSRGNEAAACGGLARWLQWLRCFLAPCARKNVDAALASLKERQFRSSKEALTLSASEVAQLQSERQSFLQAAGASRSELAWQSPWVIIERLLFDIERRLRHLWLLVTPLLADGCGHGRTSSFGIKFGRVPAAGDSVEALQEMLEFMSMERLEVPDLEVPEGWRVTARPATSRFDPGEDDQKITIDSWDGTTLRWTVDAKKFFALGGDNIAALQEVRMMCGMPMPEGSYFQARKDFRGRT